MPAPQKNIEIAIVGGGIAGTTLAIALQKHGVACQIYEQGHAFSEIGAGVAFSPNALRAMDVCDASLRRAFDKVATHNQWPEKRDVYFDVLDGVADDPARGSDDAGQARPPHVLFTLRNEQGQNAVHRGDFMDEVAAAIPAAHAHFRKHLDRVDEDAATGRLRLCFHDGTTALADGVVGCDGIKSRTRALVVGEDHPSAPPQYTHVYGYRGVIPMEQAVEHLGAERAMNAALWLGPDAHMLSYPVAGGKTFNMFGAVRDPGDWPSQEQLTLPTTREDALRDYAKFGPSIQKQLELAGENIDRWALFDLGDHPVEKYYRGRIALAGDAAHATTPHHGAGAGFCVEDAAVLAELLGDARVQEPAHVVAVWAAYDAARRPRANWLVQSSRRMCELYQRRAAGAVPDDLAAGAREMRDRYRVIWDYDLDAAIRDAKEHLGKLLG